MTSTSGPPLHSRFNEPEARAAVVLRYQRLKEKSAAQVAALQQCSEFLSQCTRYYERGIPDWTIINSIASRVLSIVLTERGKRAAEGKAIDKILRAPGPISTIVFPCSDFLGDAFASQLDYDNMAMLKGYGFVLRRGLVKPSVVERFLRERMRHFAFDLPHQPLFGNPPGSWPSLVSEGISSAEPYEAPRKGANIVRSRSRNGHRP